MNCFATGHRGGNCQNAGVQRPGNIRTCNLTGCRGGRRYHSAASPAGIATAARGHCIDQRIIAATRIGDRHLVDRQRCDDLAQQITIIECIVRYRSCGCREFNSLQRGASHECIHTDRCYIRSQKNRFHTTHVIESIVTNRSNTVRNNDGVNRGCI